MAVEIVRMSERRFVGIPVTVSFENLDRDRIHHTKRLFMEMKDKIKYVLNGEQYTCAFLANDVLFTYIYSLQVSQIIEMPAGMIGFTVPEQSYAKVRSAEQDPYAIIHRYLSDCGREADKSSLAFEVFTYGEEEDVHHADVYVPILNHTDEGG